MPRPNLNTIAAPVVSVMMALTAFVVTSNNTGSTGEPILLASYKPYPPGVLCIEQGRMITVHIAKDGTLFLRGTYEDEDGKPVYPDKDVPITSEKLTARIEELYRTRAEPVAYVEGEPRVEFGKVAEVIGRIRAAQCNVALIDKSTLEPAKSEMQSQHRAGVFIDLPWPSKSFDARPQ
jgi:biopolymer transport protein ExbD